MHEDPFPDLEPCRFRRRPPAAGEVARRTLALAALWLRSQIEVEAVLEESRTWAEAEAERLVLLAWLRSSGVHADLSMDELPLLEIEVGSLAPDCLVDATWRVEAAVPLLWALGVLSDMPPHDEEIHAAALVERVPVTLASGARECDEFAARATLRGPEEIRRQRDHAQAWQDRTATEDFPEEEDRQRVAGILFERLDALDWLCGRGRCWDETDRLS